MAAAGVLLSGTSAIAQAIDRECFRGDQLLSALDRTLDERLAMSARLGSGLLQRAALLDGHACAVRAKARAQRVVVGQKVRECLLQRQNMQPGGNLDQHSLVEVVGVCPFLVQEPALNRRQRQRPVPRLWGRPGIVGR